MVNSRCGLPFHEFVVGLLRAPVLESGVPAFRIIPEFDVPNNVTVRMFASRILGTVNPLVLQCSEEGLGHRIVVADPGAADGLAEAMLLQGRRELAGCVIAAAVGVKPNSV